MPRRQAPGRRRRIRSLVGAALLGAGAVLGAKSRAEDHWSRSPAATYDAEGVEGAVGTAPPDAEPDTRTAPVAGRSAAGRRGRPARRRWWHRSTLSSG